MSPRPDPARRGWLMAAGSLALATAATAGTDDARNAAGAGDAVTLYTFGDSVLDCGHYNPHGVHPGQLLVRNDDALFPAFRGWDLQSRGPARLEHRARDGATVDDLARQLSGVAPRGRAVALVSVGGNDLIRGLAGDRGPGLRPFEAALARFVAALPVRPVFLANVYDPTFGHDERNFLGVDAATARANHRRVNDVIAGVAARHGRAVDLHAHFLAGDPSWFTRTIEPSLVGASQVRRAFGLAIGLPA